MNKRGFTLVELLGVILIIVVMMLLTFPAVESVINKSKSTVYDAQIKNILTASYDFSLKNSNILPNDNETNYITLGELKTFGLLDFNLKNPNTQDEFPNDLVISIKKVQNGYKNTNLFSKVEGKFLYTVEISKLEETDNKPIISIPGQLKNSNNNFVLTMDLNSNINSITYSAVSYDNNDLTSKVKYYITKDSSVVDEIDTSNSGIYKINYFVVDDEGNSSSSILNLIIADTTKPVIDLPDRNSISISTTDYNLLSGVSCTDNSGFCDISYTGDITYGTKGKYVIEYTGIDPSGNTTVVRRVITVE